MNLSPAQSLILLVLVGLSISGWFYGVYWKRVADGSIFTKEEKVIFQLQDQIEVLTTKNQELSEAISKLKDPDGEFEVTPKNQTAPVTPGVLAPFEKVELPKKSRF